MLNNTYVVEAKLERLYLGELFVESLHRGEEAAPDPEGLLLEALVFVGDGLAGGDVSVGVLEQHVQNLKYDACVRVLMKFTF